MSKIGKINIQLPEKVKVIINENTLNIEGPQGKKTLPYDKDIFEIKINDGKDISIKPKIINDETKRLWGMNRSLLNNAIIGANEGYTKNLELVGVGYRGAIKGSELNLQLGFSHDINFKIPEGIKIIVEKQTNVKISGSDKQLVGMVASQIKSLRPPEPYKGKGIKEVGQYILRKEGKKK
tara:strand:- start:9 stop:548 length:540 start_codon:yes stop_codon:yes gene_type:complete